MLENLPHTKFSIYTIYGIGKLPNDSLTLS